MEQEKSKKILVISAVLMLFAGTCYYYGSDNSLVAVKPSSQAVIVTNDNKKPVKSPIKPINFKQEAPKSKELNKAVLLINNKLVKDNKDIEVKNNKEIKKEEVIKTTVKEIAAVPSAKLRPTGKSDLLTLAGNISGKRDPFSYSESRSVLSSEAGDKKQASMPTGLPPVPVGGKIGNLPSLPGLPGFNGAHGLASPPAPRPQNEIIIKGFIGNKVIAEIDGVVESLSPNEKIGAVKVLSVDSSNFTAKFLVKNKVVVKTLKTLTSGETSLNNFELAKLPFLPQ